MHKRLYSNQVRSKAIAKSKMHQELLPQNMLHQLKKKIRMMNSQMVNQRNEILL